MAFEEERPADTSGEASLTRRHALGTLLAGAGAAGLGLTLGGPVESAQARTRVFHGAWPYFTPPDGHFNTFIQDGSALAFGIYQDLMEMPLAMYYWQAQKWLWLLATDATFQGQNFVVYLRKGVRWSDGSAFTARDVLDTWMLWRLLGNDLFDYVDTIHAPNDHQVVFHMKIPSTLVERMVLHQMSPGLMSVSAPRASSVYGSFAARFRELLDRGYSLDSGEVKTLQAQLGQFRPSTMVVNGPFQIDPTSITPDQVTLQHNPSSWASPLVHFDRIILYNGDTAAITPVVLADLVDYLTHGFPRPPTGRSRRRGSPSSPRRSTRASASSPITPESPPCGTRWPARP
jgi:peptide/nickel transport system substrate-binding protein